MMMVMTHDERFKMLLDNDDEWKLTGLSAALRRKYRYKLKHGQFVGMDKKIEIMKKAGIEVPEVRWMLPKGVS